MAAKEKKGKAKAKKYPVPSIRWTPNPPIYQEDNIISSTAKEKNIWGFMPTYEVNNEPIYMRFIMNMEYQRIWLKERDAFDRAMYTKKREITTTDNNVPRRRIQRYFTYKKPTKFSLLEAKYRDPSKLSKDELFALKLKETKYKVKCEEKKEKKPDKLCTCN